MDVSDAVPRIFLAILLGAIIGLEREFTQKSAGLRTHILVTLGATIFTWVSMSNFYNNFDPAIYQSHLSIDPTRVAAQIVSGIGFIGGGAVLRFGTTIKGLTTAASLWTMASIGMLVGLGQFRLAIISTLLAFLVLFTIGKLERRFFIKTSRAFNRMRVHVVVDGSAAETSQAWMEAHFRNAIVEAETRTDPIAEQFEMNYILNVEPGKGDVNQISRQLGRLAGVTGTTVKTYYESEDAS